MNEATKDKILSEILANVKAVLEEQRANIFDLYDKARAAHTARSEFKFPVGLKATLQPNGPAMEIAVDSAVGFRATATAESVVPGGPDMFEG